MPLDSQAPGPAPSIAPDSLTAALASPEVEVRRRAVVALGEARRVDAGAPIALLLGSDPDPSVRAEAATALALILGREAASALLAAVDDAALEVRTRAIVSLGRVGAAESLARLHEVGLGGWDPRPLVKEAAQVAQRTICRERTEEAAACILALLRAEGRSARACADLVRVLSKETEKRRYESPPPPVPPALEALFVEACADGAAEVRAAAAGLAENLRLPGAADHLLGALERCGGGEVDSEILAALAAEVERTRDPGEVPPAGAAPPSGAAPPPSAEQAESRAARACAAVLPHFPGSPQHAATILSGHPGCATTEALVGLLGGADAAHLGPVVEALEVRADPSTAVPLLARLEALLADRPERAPGLDCALVSAIAAAGDRCASAPLLAHLRTLVSEELRRTPSRRGALLAALVGALERLGAPAPPDLIAQALEQELGVVACAELACALLRAGDARGIEAAVDALAFTRRMRPVPGDELERPADGGASREAEALLRASLPPLLASLGAAAVDALLAHSESERAGVRATALTLLESLGDLRAAPAVRRCLEDEDGGVREAAESAAGALGDPACAALVLAGLQRSESPACCERSLRRLIERHGPEIPVEALRRIAAVKDRFVAEWHPYGGPRNRRISLEDLRLLAKKALGEAPES